MNRSLLPSKILILLVAACLGWIAILSLAFVIVVGTGVSAGWIVGAALMLAVGVWALVMRREFRQAIAEPASSLQDHDLTLMIRSQARPSSFRRLSSLFSKRAAAEPSSVRRTRSTSRCQSLPRKNGAWRKSSPHRSSVR